jgi:hypothetical protein
LSFFYKYLTIEGYHSALGLKLHFPFSLEP